MSIEQGPERRALLEGAAGELFREVVGRRRAARRRPAAGDGHPDHAALDLLIDLGPAARGRAIGGWVAVDPAAVQSAWWRRWAVRWSSCSTSPRRGPTPSARWPSPSGVRRPAAARSTEIRGLPSINRFLEAAVDDAESELLTAQPAGPRRAVVLEQAVDRDMRALERGVHDAHALPAHGAAQQGHA